MPEVISGANMYVFLFLILVGSLLITLLLGTNGDELTSLWHRVIDRVQGSNCERVFADIRRRASQQQS